MALVSINPATEEVIAEFDELTYEEAKALLSNSKKAFNEWKNTPLQERTLLLRKLKENLTKNRDIYAALITKEMGKPIKESRAEIEKCAWLCEYYADNAEKFLADELTDTGAYKSFISFEPLGIILGIMPWNFPFWQVFRFAVPAIAAGNVAALKHASNVSGSSVQIGRIFLDSGFPPGVFTSLLISSDTAMKIIDHDLVDAVSLTGSLSAGSKVGEVACRRIKKIVLELGGSDPFIVLPGADIKRAAKTAVNARHLNTGQSCIAAKRFIVHKDVAEEFKKHFLEHFNSLKIGDPMDESTDIGPLAKKEFIKDLTRQLDSTECPGCEVTRLPIPDKGYYFSPTVVFDAKNDLTIVREEVFGPIAPIIVVNNEEEAVRIANSTEFGLGASVWTHDLKKAEELARKIEAGFVAVNQAVRSDPRMPFGGIKKSGIGRELSPYGIREFVNIKSVVIQE